MSFAVLFPSYIGSRGRTRLLSEHPGYRSWIETGDPMDPVVVAAHRAGSGAGVGADALLDDGTCWWVGIDIDPRAAATPDDVRTPEQIAQAVAAFNLPINVWETKTAPGTLLTVHFTEPRAVETVRGPLLHALAVLGLGPRNGLDKSVPDLFGKVTLPLPRTDPTRISWMNLPLFGATRRLVEATGPILDADEAIRRALARRERTTEWLALPITVPGSAPVTPPRSPLSPDWYTGLRNLPVIDPRPMNPWHDGPPCMQRFFDEGGPPPQHARAALHFGALMLKRAEEKGVGPNWNKRTRDVFADATWRVSQIEILKEIQRVHPMDLDKPKNSPACSTWRELGYCDRDLCITRPVGIHLWDERPDVTAVVPTDTHDSKVPPFRLHYYRSDRTGEILYAGIELLDPPLEVQVPLEKLTHRDTVDLAFLRQLGRSPFRYVSANEFRGVVQDRQDAGEFEEHQIPHPQTPEEYVTWWVTDFLNRQRPSRNERELGTSAVPILEREDEQVVGVMIAGPRLYAEYEGSGGTLPQAQFLTACKRTLGASVRTVTIRQTPLTVLRFPLTLMDPGLLVQDVDETGHDSDDLEDCVL